MNRKMVIKGVGTLLTKRICPNGEKELMTLGTLQDLKIDLSTEIDDVFGGDGLFAIDSIVTSKAITVTGTDAKFDLNAISLMMGSSITNGEGNAWALNEKQVVQTNKTIVLKHPISDLQLPYELAPEESITLRLENSNRVIPKEAFEVSNLENVTTITINHSDVSIGDVVIASYQYKVKDMSVADILADEVPFPVHVIHHGSFQQKDGTKQDIETELYACQARGTFSIDAQRATASSSAIELQILDPERPDGKIGSIKRYQSGESITECKVDELDWIDPPVEPNKFVVTFEVNEPESTIEVRDVNEILVEPESYGVYKLENGIYSYTVSKEGFDTKEDTFIVGDKSLAVEVILQQTEVTP